jgi:hypothetical protein
VNAPYALPRAGLTVDPATIVPQPATRIESDLRALIADLASILT